VKLHVVLVAPEIAPNTGNIIRLCANTGATLHLVEPLGFTLDERSLRRAGLDYHELADVQVHGSWALLVAAVPAASLHSARRYALTSRGTRRYDTVHYEDGDVLVFGAESAGLDEATLAAFAPDERLTLPMRAGNRSLNLANAVAVVVYEAWRQHDFAGASGNASTSETTRPD
jgi:tRNA (cytidine/uridine-2'-O-)-methyltransferase